jgi:hypothetical protein
MRHSTLYRALAIIGFVTLCQAGGHAQEMAPADWSALLRYCSGAGLGSSDVEEIVRRCQSQGVSLREAHMMLASACTASRAGLPPEPALIKIEEGLAKRVPAETIVSAVERRVMYLLRAREVAESSEGKLSSDDVIVSAALAMESGLEEQVVQAVFAAGRGKRPAEIRAAIEAGEALHLEGFAAEDVEPLLTDCLNRNLRRLEIRRMVRYALQQRARGMAPHAIRQSLWGNPATQPDAGARTRAGAGQDDAPGHGPGPGGPPPGRPGQP